MKCKDCEYFEFKRMGQRGAIRGVCRKSASDQIYWKQAKMTRVGSVPACKRFKEKA